MPSWNSWLHHPQSFWLRKLVFQVHLWSGLAIGMYVVIICISGSILIFRSELRQTFEPTPRFVTVANTRLSEDELNAVVNRAYPDHSVSRILEREDPARAITVTLDQNGQRLQILFDPYTGEDLGHRLPLPYRMTTWLLDLHDNLLYADTGRHINGLGAIMLTLLSVTGAIIWWPGTGHWRSSLKVDFRANWARFNWSLHGFLGFWSLAFVFMWGLTGIYLAFPEPFTELADRLEPINEETFEPRTVDNVLYWFARIHFGRFGGWSTKILWALVGLIPPALFVTGFLMWWNRVVRPLNTSRHRKTTTRAPNTQT